MGCFPSSVSHVEAKYIFHPNDISKLIQSWNIIRSNDPQKFAYDVLIKIVDQSPIIRQYYRSKVQVEGNNYDYGDHDSCLKSDKSWQLGLKEYSDQSLVVFERLVSTINDDNQFQAQLRMLITSETKFAFEYQTLSIIRQSFVNLLHQRLKLVNHELCDEYEKVWNQIFIFSIDYLIKQKNV